MARANKGSAFEREVCKQLSLWYTNGAHDDIFWRSTTSGARATTRSKQGKRTSGQYGDITATDPSGQPLMDLFTIELKRGYPKATIHDMLDKMNGASTQQWEDWFAQVKTSQIESNTASWMLITKRDRREALCHIPITVLDQLEMFKAHMPYPSAIWRARVSKEKKGICKSVKVMTLPLREFLGECNPAKVKTLGKQWASKRK